MKKTLATIAMLCYIAICSYGTDENQRKITIIFRFDDYSATSNFEIEKQIFEAFTRINKPFTIGVIPFVNEAGYSNHTWVKNLNLGPEKEEILKNACHQGIVEVALHGFSHQRSKEGKRTEFSGMDYLQQYEKIINGKKCLEEVIGEPVNTFIPPWNSYDMTTLQVLQELNFQNISADLVGRPDKNSKLNFIPYTCVLSNVVSAVHRARKNITLSPVIIVMFHQYDFKEVDPAGNFTMEEFRNLLDLLASQKDIVFSTLGKAQDLVADLSADRYSQYFSRYRLSQKILPLINFGSQGLYTPRWRILETKILMYLYIILLPILIGLVIYKLLPKKPVAGPINSVFLKSLPALLFFAVLIGMVLLDIAGYRVIFLLQIITGIVFGTTLTIYRHKRIRIPEWPFLLR